VKPTTELRVRSVYARDIDEYVDRELLVPEVKLLQRLRGRWGELDMLDIGVGAGRTALTFAAITRSYLGIDFTPEMVERCRDLMLDADGAVEFAEADARRLTTLGREFDVVLFSKNGIDTLDTADRAAVLAEVRAVLRDGGTFLFSSHSLDGLPLASPLSQVRGRGLGRAARIGAALRRVPRVRAINRGLDLQALHDAGYGLVFDGTHGGDLVMHYVSASWQAEQLRGAGFEVEAVIDEDGRTVPGSNPGRSLTLHYVCRPS
jgi:SAM-dependent methyltransferase